MTATAESSTSTAVSVDSLRRALTAEYAVADMLDVVEVQQLARGNYPRMLAAEVRQARQRINDLDARLAAIDDPAGPVSVTAKTVRRFAGDALGMPLATMPAGLDVVRRRPVEPALLEHAHRLAAAVASAHTNHCVLAELARSVGDVETSELAEACRGELDDLHAKIDAAVPELAAAVLEATTRPTYREAAGAATDRVRLAASHIGDDASLAGHDLRHALTRLWPRSSTSTPPEQSRLQAVADAANLPISDYTQRSAAQIIEQLPDLAAHQLADVERYESAHANRVTVLDKVRALRDERSAT